MKTKLFFVILVVSIAFCANAQVRQTPPNRPSTSITNVNPALPGTSVRHEPTVQPVPLVIQTPKVNPNVQLNEIQQQKQRDITAKKVQGYQDQQKKDEAKNVGCCCLIKGYDKQPDQYIWCPHGSSECAGIGGSLVNDYFCTLRK